MMLANLRTNASAAKRSRPVSALASLPQSATETCSLLLISRRRRRRARAGREMLVPLWAPAARCRQPSERSGARWWPAAPSLETAREKSVLENVSTELLFTVGISAE